MTLEGRRTRREFRAALTAAVSGMALAAGALVAAPKRDGKREWFSTDDMPTYGYWSPTESFRHELG